MCAPSSRRERERESAKKLATIRGGKAESKKTNNGMNFCTHTRSTVVVRIVL